MTLTVPIRTVSEANTREHWAARHLRKKRQQAAVLACMVGRRVPPEPPYLVTLTRVASRAMDSDNLAGSFKHVQDEVARLLGVDDGDAASVRWVYAQRKGKPREYAVEIAVDVAPEAK